MILRAPAWALRPLSGSGADRLTRRYLWGNSDGLLVSVEISFRMGDRKSLFAAAFLTEQLAPRIAAGLSAFRQTELNLLDRRQRLANRQQLIATALSSLHSPPSSQRHLPPIFLDRRHMQHRLRERETELQHASNLSAMGETVAALVHEINQPSGASSWRRAILNLSSKCFGVPSDTLVMGTATLRARR